MRHYGYQRISCIALLIVIYIAAFSIQQHLFLNWDVSYLLHATQLMLAGGTYTNDFFTPNPPMVLFLYTPPIWLHKLTSLSLVSSFSFYITLLASLSLYLCWQLTRIIFAYDSILQYIFLISLSICFLIAPIYEFGQREHLLLFLTMPYVLLITTKLQDYKPAWSYAFLIGMLAGFGLALKPQFMLTWIMLEIYIGIKQKSWTAWLRTENIAIFSVLVLHFFIIASIYPDYLSTVVPFLMRNYYNNINEPNINLTFKLNSLVIFCFSCIALYLIAAQRINWAHKTITTILLITLISFIINYYAQHAAWYYHLLPALAIAFALTIILLYAFNTNENSNLDYLLLTILCSVYLIFLYCRFRWWSYNENLNLIILASVLTLFGLFILIYKNIARLFLHRILIAILTIILFSIPVYSLSKLFILGLQYKIVLNNLINTTPNKPNQSVYVFSYATWFGFPLPDYAQINNVQRFDSLWMLLNLHKLADVKKPLSTRDQTMVINMINDDFKRHKPNLVFNTIQRTNNSEQYNFLAYFLTNNEFQQTWQHYTYIGSKYYHLSQREILELQIYQRKDAL